MITEREKMFLAEVKAYSHIGYGRMMQIISNLWHEQLERDSKGTGKGALVANGCLAFLPEKEKKAFFEVLELEKRNGMNY